MKDIPRSSSKISYDVFIKLVELMKKNEWLCDETEALVELWNFCDEEHQQILIEELLNDFKYLNSKDLKNLGREVANHIREKWELTHRGTKVVAISDTKEADGSQAFLQSIKNKFVFEGSEWSERNFVNSLPKAAHSVRSNQTLILIDDFVGTGNTLDRKYEWLTKTIANRALKDHSSIDIKFVAIAGMEFARDALDKLGIDYYVPIWLKKGISEKYTGHRLEISTNAMKKLEKKLCKAYSGLYLQSFGYKKSESLFAIESFNVPNNVFPVFWWPYDKDRKFRNTLFKRLR